MTGIIRCGFLITGGAGCLGSNLVEHWLPQGHEILVSTTLQRASARSLPAHPRPDARRRLDRGPELVTGYLPNSGQPTSFIPPHPTRTRRLAGGRGHQRRGDHQRGRSGASGGRRRFMNFQPCSVTAGRSGRRSRSSIRCGHSPATEFPKVAGEQYLAISGCLMFRSGSPTSPVLAWRSVRSRPSTTG